MKPILILLAVCALAPSGRALNPNRLLSQIQKHHWQIEDGLPHNYVNAITIGPDGYLWIGTDEGLVRFDGANFSAPLINESLHLDRRWIPSLLPSRLGGYWVGTYDHFIYRIQDGVAREQFPISDPALGFYESSSGDFWYYSGGFHRRDPSQHTESFPNCSGNDGNSWQMFSEDSHGAIWMAYARGLCRYRNGVAENVLTIRDEGTPLSLMQDKGGSLWLGTSKGLFRVAQPDSAPHLVSVSGIAGPVSCIRRDRDGVLWIGTWGKGLFRIANGGVSSWSSRDGLPDDFIRTIFEDPEGNLWFGSRSGGLNRWKDTFIEPFGIPEGLAGNFASALSGDAAGVLWLGTYRSGVYQFRDNSITAVRTPAPALDLVVGAMAHDPDGALWLGAWTLLSRYEGQSFQTFTQELPPGCNGAVSIAFDKSRRFWIGCESGLYRYPNLRPQADKAMAVLQGRRVRTLLAASDGTIWAGTDQGLVHIAGESLQWFKLDDGLPDPNVRYVSEDSAHRIWVTTNAPGLTLVTDRKLRTLDARAGLPSHSLNKPIDDGSGTLWVSSSHGILELPSAQLNDWVSGRQTSVEIIRHDIDDGMRSVECHGASQPGGWRNTDGSLWFPTAKGFVRVVPSMRRRQAPPSVVIEELRAGGEPISSKPFRLQPGVRDVEVRYTALRFGSAGHVRFRYRLEGADPDWNDAGPERTIHFTTLPPGSYRLLIAARDEGGEWSTTPAVLAIEQLPRFHQTWVFRLLVVAVCMSLIAAIYAFRVRRLRLRYAAVAAERSRIAREWHDTLLAGLSGVSWQLEAVKARLRSDPDRAPAALDTAKKMVDHCSAEARRVIWDLRDTGAENPTLPKAVTAFLEKLSEGTSIDGALDVRGDYVKLSYDVEYNALRVAQEAIANAIRHAESSHIAVLLEYTAKQLMLQITDDGKGFVPRDLASTGHFGILGMRERVLNFGGDFDITSAPGQGTRISASFPISKGSAE